MKHIKNYNNFQVNEALTQNQRSWLNLPRFLFALIGKKLFDIHPLLNFRYDELKQRTSDSDFSPILASSSRGILKYDPIKITDKDIPKNKLGFGMFFNNWNIYLSKEVKGDSKRSTVFITRDEIKKGDKVSMERLGDKDIYPDKVFIKNSTTFKNPLDFPMIVLLAKYDHYEKSKKMEGTIDDICLELEDDYPIAVTPKFNDYNDKLFIDIAFNDGSSVVFDDNLNQKVVDISDRIKEYLRLEGMNFNYDMYWKIKGPFYYYGEKGRFEKELKDASWDYNKGGERSDEIYKSRKNYSSYSSCFDISIIGNQYGYDLLRITTDDIKTLLSDIDKCYRDGYLSFDSTKDSDVDAERNRMNIIRNKINEIPVRNITVIFKKVKR